MCGSMPPGMTRRSCADTVRAACRQRAGAAHQHDASVLHADIGGLGSRRQHAGAAGDGEVEHQVALRPEGGRRGKARRFAVGEAAQDLVRLEIAYDEDKPAGPVGIGPALQPARRIERVLHGVDRRRPAGTVGEFDQSLDPQELLAVIARQPAQRHGKSQPAHRPLQPDRQGVDAVGMHRRRMGPRPRQRLGRAAEQQGAGVGVARPAGIDDRRQRVQRRQSLDKFVRDGRQIGLGQEQQVGHGGLRDGLGITIERARADHGIDRRHDAVEAQRGFEKGVGGKRVERGPGIGQAAGLERDAAERRPAGGLTRSQQPVERVGQALAHGAAGAAVGQLDHIVDRRFQQMMVERDGAELADEDGGIAQIRKGENAGKKRGLAAAQKAGQHRERDRLRRHFRQGGKTTIHGWTSLGIKLRNLVTHGASAQSPCQPLRVETQEQIPYGAPQAEENPMLDGVMLLWFLLAARVAAVRRDRHPHPRRNRR